MFHVVVTQASPVWFLAPKIFFEFAFSFLIFWKFGFPFKKKGLPMCGLTHRFDQWEQTGCIRFIILYSGVGSSFCKDYGCEGKCQPFPDGTALCLCKEGFKLDESGKKCVGKIV